MTSGPFNKSQNKTKEYISDNNSTSTPTCIYTLVWITCPLQYVIGT